MSKQIKNVREGVKSTREWPRPANILPPTTGQTLAQYQGYVAAYRLYVEELNRQRVAYFNQKKLKLAKRPKPMSKDKWVEKHRPEIEKQLPKITTKVPVVDKKFIPGRPATKAGYKYSSEAGVDVRVPAQAAIPDRWEEKRTEKVVVSVDPKVLEQKLDSTWKKVVSKRNQKKEKRRLAAAQPKSSGNETAKAQRLAAKHDKQKAPAGSKRELQGDARKQVLKKLRHLSKAPPSQAFIQKAWANIAPEVAKLPQPERSRLLLANREKIEGEVINSPGYRDFIKKYREVLGQSLYGHQNADRLIAKRLDEVTRVRVEKAVREAFHERKEFDSTL